MGMIIPLAATQRRAYLTQQARLLHIRIVIGPGEDGGQLMADVAHAGTTSDKMYYVKTAAGSPNVGGR